MFKKNFERICMSKNLSPTSVCVAIGLSNSMYSEWTEKSVPRKTTLMKLADYLGVTVDDLLREDEGVSSEETVFLTPEEKKIILAYRKKKGMQEAVKKLLLDDIPLVEHYAIAAYEGDTEVKKKHKKTVISP